MGTISTTMMTSKTKKKTPDSFFGPLPHRFSYFQHLRVVRATLAFFLAAWFAAASLAAAPAPPFQSPSPRGPHAHDFLIFTTVFTDKGFALYGARTRLRRAEEKKYRWEATSDHSGELAFRVPPGAQYEMTVEAKGFKTETRKIDAGDGVRADLTVRLEPLSGASSVPYPDLPAGGKP